MATKGGKAQRIPPLTTHRRSLALSVKGGGLRCAFSTLHCCMPPDCRVEPAEQRAARRLVRGGQCHFCRKLTDTFRES